ncbi:MAG TPA: hypothetical protein VEB21_03185 [Terriglobales bacterium]|nr:hypothetical protein [Terriglobales bacterium]
MKRNSVLLIALLAGACARQSPQLPPDLSSMPAEQRLLMGDTESAEGKLDCPALAAEYESNKDATAKLEHLIAANRGHNQGVVYVGSLLFLPLLLAVKPDDDAKKTLDQLQTQRDRIDRLAKAKGCTRQLTPPVRPSNKTS